MFMVDVEILGRTIYHPVKYKLQEGQNPLFQINSSGSKKTPINTDVVYERDEGDWWWCEDV